MELAFHDFEMTREEPCDLLLKGDTVRKLVGKNEEGSAVIGVCVSTAIVGVIIFFAVHIGQILIHRAEARTAADASALAGVYGGRESSENIAQQNGALLISFADQDGYVEVSVEVKGQSASSRAEKEMLSN